MKDGLSSVAWSTLVSGHSTEKDHRVLEAFKMSQVHFTNQWNPSIQDCPIVHTID